MRIRLSDIKARQAIRPEGYYEEYVSKGKVEGDVLIIDGNAHLEMMRKYNPTAKNVIQLAGCGSCGKPKEQPSMPPITTVAKNAMGAAGRLITQVVSGQQIKADDALIKERTAICGGCEFWNSEKQRCSICGCYTKTKISLAYERCPKGFW